MCGILYWAIGFAFQFGVGNGFIGHEFFFLHEHARDYGTTGVAFLAFFLFQFAFADTASTITSGAMVGRTSFKGDIIYSIIVSGFIYPIFGHWVWGPGGWLGNTMGWFAGFVNNDGGIVFRDFAGSTVVHTVGGVIALAGCIVLGPRLGRKFKRDGGGPMPRPRHRARRHRRRDPVVRLVRLQPRLDAVGDGLRGHRPGRGQHHARRMRRRTRRRAVRLSEIEEVGPRHRRQRLPRRPRRHHRARATGCRRWARS